MTEGGYTLSKPMYVSYLGYLLIYLVRYSEHLYTDRPTGLQVCHATNLVGGCTWVFGCGFDL